MAIARMHHRSHGSVDQQASRLVAIRAIVDLAEAEGDETHDVVTEALLVLGASQEELAAAMLGGRHGTVR
jgi:hypothetical protein